MSVTPVDRLNAVLEGRYRIESELGEGGMATVYLAEDLKHQRQVAIKVLRPELAAVIGAERFLTEIRTTAKLQHPHILALFDSGDVDGLLYYVMPYVEGESLGDRLAREKQLPVDEAIRIASEVADALSCAHRHGVIHRDIKPENVLLQDGRALVADFGIALAVTAAGSSRLTETGLSLGTPAYMSPEQATGDREVDGRADIYALGCLLYEMLAGQPPHLGTTAQAILAKVLTTDPEPVTLHRETVAPHVEATLHRAMARLPADRFASADDFLAALSNPELATARTHPGSVSPGASQGSQRVVIGLSVLSAVLAAVALWGWLGDDPMESGVRHITIPPPPGLAFVSDGYIPALSPDGATVVFAARDGDQIMLYRRPVDGFEAEAIEGTEDAEYAFFSPDGQWVGFFTESPEEIRKVLLEGGDPITIVADLGAAQNDAIWRRDGTIVFSWERQGLWSVSDAGGEPHQLTVPDTANGEFDHVRPQELPDGRLLFAMSLGATYTQRLVANEMASAILEPDGTWERLDGQLGGIYRPEGLMLFEAGGTWTAQRFDLASARAVPPERSILGGALDGPRWHPNPLSFSNSGDVAYFSGAGDVEWVLTLVDTAGNASVMHPEPGRYRWPRISPNGDVLLIGGLFSAGWGLRTLDLTSGALRPFPTEIGSPGEAAWSMDGRQIAFTAEGNPDNQFASIYVKNSTGTGDERLVVAAPFDAWTSAWAPDGTHLAFYGGVVQDDIWVQELEPNGELHQVTTGIGTERHPHFSPNGAWIAYQSDQSGRSEIYVRGFPDFETEHPVSIEGGTEPLWAAKGSELFYRNGSQIMVVDVETGTDFSAGVPRLLLQTFLEDDPNSDRSYDVMPDGRSFVIIRSDPRTQPELRIIKGWVSELKARLGG